MARIEQLKYISVSSIEDYLDDRLRWCYKWVENRVPRSVPSALVMGKIIHKAFEEHFKNGTPIHVALESLLPPADAILTEKEQKEVDQLRGLVEPLMFWKDQFPIQETLEVEEPFEFYLTSGAKFRGRPDRVVRAYDTVVFHMQHKSIGATVDPATYCSLMSEKLHELLYGYHLQKKYAKQGYTYGGTIADIIRKLKYRSKAKGKDFNKILHSAEEMLFQVTIPIRPASVAQAYDEANELSVHMDRTMGIYLSDGLIPRNRRLDGTNFGKGVDLYTLVALGEIDINDDTYFMDREETYEVPDVEE